MSDSTSSSPDRQSYAVAGLNPWTNGAAASHDYPTLYSNVLYVLKRQHSVTREKWPYQKIFAKQSTEEKTPNSLVQIPYDKFIGYGPPPESLPGRVASIYLDYTDEELPLIYYWSGDNNAGHWEKYNEDVVLSGDKQASVEMLYHPQFREDKNYLGSYCSWGICWIAWNAANPPKTNKRKPKGGVSTCNFDGLFFEGIEEDRRFIRKTDEAILRRDQELERRKALKPQRSLPLPKRQRDENIASSNDPTKRLKMSASGHVSEQGGNTNDPSIFYNPADGSSQSLSHTLSSANYDNDHGIPREGSALQEVLGSDLVNQISERCSQLQSNAQNKTAELDNAKAEIRELRDELESRESAEDLIAGLQKQLDDEINLRAKAEADLAEARMERDTERQRVIGFLSSMVAPPMAEGSSTGGQL